MLLIGLTGGIGAGKSTVAALFAARGAGIVDADGIAREIVEAGEPALEELRAEFGDGVIAADGTLDRAGLAGLAFASPERTAALNAIMHPAIARRTARHLDALSDREVVVHDVPLLVENGLTANYHLSVLIDVPEEIRLERLTTLRGLDADDARRRIRAQATDAQRFRACDVRLDNSGTEEQLRAQFDTLWETRIAPFRRTRIEGVPATPQSAAAEETDPNALQTAGERLIARLDRAMQTAGVDAQTSAASSDDDAALALRLTTGDPGPALEQALRDAGWVPDSVQGTWQSADPGRPATLVVAGPQEP